MRQWNETGIEKVFITTFEKPKQENPNVNPLKYQLYQLLVVIVGVGVQLTINSVNNV